MASMTSMMVLLLVVSMILPPGNAPSSPPFGHHPYCPDFSIGWTHSSVSWLGLLTTLLTG